MKKPYVAPEVEVLEFSETECFDVPPTTPPKEILSSTGEVVGYEEVKTTYTCSSTISHKKKWHYCWPWGWFYY